MAKYALYTYSTINIGDDIQSLAARRFLPQVDYYIDRDKLNQFVADTDEDIKLIMNGWYAHEPEGIPFDHEQITPLLTSMYIADASKEVFQSDSHRQFLKKHEPVGARNPDTQEFLESIGVESYFSGCLTLTLNPEPEIQKRDFILAVDVPSSVLEKLRRESNYPIIAMDVHTNHIYQSPDRRLRVAEYYLYLYQSARCVVTSRLHATLPCLGLGTPVLNIDISFEPGRFAGLRELAHHMTVDDFLMSNDYDVNHPPVNPKKYLKIRNELIKTCKKFTDYDSNLGFLNGKSLLDLLSDSNLVQEIVTGFHSNYERFKDPYSDFHY